jgi:hypothetical protein
VIEPVRSVTQRPIDLTAGGNAARAGFNQASADIFRVVQVQDETRGLQEFNTVRGEFTKVLSGPDGLLSRRGTDAFGVTERGTEEYDRLVSAARERLGDSAYAGRIFDEQVARDQRRQQDYLLSYETTQTQAANIAQLQATVEVDAEAIASAPESDVDGYVLNTVLGTEVLADEEGVDLGPDGADQREMSARNATSPGLARQILTIALDSPQRATRMLERFSNPKGVQLGEGEESRFVPHSLMTEADVATVRRGIASATSLREKGQGVNEVLRELTGGSARGLSNLRGTAIADKVRQLWYGDDVAKELERLRKLDEKDTQLGRTRTREGDMLSMLQLAQALAQPREEGGDLSPLSVEDQWTAMNRMVQTLSVKPIYDDEDRQKFSDYADMLLFQNGEPGVTNTALHRTWMSDPSTYLSLTSDKYVGPAERALSIRKEDRSTLDALEKSVNGLGTDISGAATREAGGWMDRLGVGDDQRPFVARLYLEAAVAQQGILRRALLPSDYREIERGLSTMFDGHQYLAVVPDNMIEGILQQRAAHFPPELGLPVDNATLKDQVTALLNKRGFAAHQHTRSLQRGALTWIFGQASQLPGFRGTKRFRVDTRALKGAKGAGKL